MDYDNILLIACQRENFNLEVKELLDRGVNIEDKKIYENRRKFTKTAKKPLYVVDSGDRKIYKKSKRSNTRKSKIYKKSKRSNKRKSKRSKTRKRSNTRKSKRSNTRKSKRSKTRSKRSKTRRKSKRSKTRRSKRSRNKQTIILQKSDLSDKKYMVTVGSKTVNFGAKGYSDYTIHKDEERMHRYENRHKKRENWKKSGITTAGFWSKWILWNKPSFIGSIKDTEKRFNIKIINKTKKS